MKIALTADLHLTTREVHPDRYDVLEDIFRQMLERDIRVLVIAGDLFDHDLANHSDFDRLCTDVNEQGVEIWVIGGNHDMRLEQRMFSAENLHVIPEPELVTLDEDAPPLMMLPFAEKNMGEALEPFATELQKQAWILVAHGDYIPAMRGPHPLEPGVYMPLTGKDLQVYRPRRAFLGHIHKPYDGDNLHYMGSPCSLDPTETGRRRFLVYDLVDDTIEPNLVQRGPLRFSVDVLCVPGEQELEWVQRDIDRVIAAWELSPGEQERVQVRVKVRGVANNLNAVVRAVEDCFQEFNVDGGVDASDLSFTNDPDRSRIVKRVDALLDDLEWNFQDETEPSRNDVLAAAVKTIYGV